MKLVEKHPLWIRLTHWFNVPLLGLMIWSGILIYWANPVYDGFFPKWFYDIFAIDHRLAEGMYTHFTVAWLFVVNSLIYILLTLITRHRRELFPDRDSIKAIGPTLLHEIGLKKNIPPHGKFNAAQRVAYTSVLIIGIVEVLSGFAIYKPVQLQWLRALFGGYEVARLVHFVAMISFCLFIIVHIVQVARAGWNNFRSIVAGFEVLK